MNPLAGSLAVEPQKVIRPPAVGLGGTRGQSADLEGRLGLLKPFHFFRLPRKNGWVILAPKWVHLSASIGIDDETGKDYFSNNLLR